MTIAMIMVHSNLSRAMKKTCYILGVAFGAALALVSCGREAIEPEAVTPGSETGNQVTLTINARQGTDSKTYIDGTDVKWATSGEKLKVFEEYTASGATDVTLTPVTSSEGTTEDSGATMTFAASFDEATADSYAYYAFYPSSAYNSKPTTVEKVAIEVKSTQTPTASSFDPSADILIAKPETVTAQATSLDMEFARVVAVGKMTLTGLTSSDPVTQVTFSATDAEGNAVTLAGRTAYNLSDASIAGNNTEATSIVLNYSALSLTANESMDVWFTCLPFSLSGAGSFKVVVETASETFTKDVSLSESQNLKFIAGKASRFTVDMSSVSGSEKAVDLCYAELTYSDFTGGEGYASSGYNNVTVSKTHGDIWSMNATNATSTIGLKKTTESDNSSYIKLPDFESNITSVFVTCSGTDASDSLALRTSADFSGNYIFGESEHTLLTSGATSATYTFDLSSKSVKTAYLKAFGHQIKVTKVVVLAGTDTRTALDAPASVSATVDAETVNTINVSWEAVSGAASYIVTLYDKDLNVIKTVSGVSEASYSFTDLIYSSSYIVTVKASPSDYYTNKDSIETDSDVVTTGENTSGINTYAYLFTAKDWSATLSINSGTSATSAWTSGKDGAGYSNSGIQVTTAETGANGTSPYTFTDVEEIVVTYCTNTKNGVGTIVVQVGDGTAQTFSVTKPSSGGTTPKEATFSYSTKESGAIKITVNCTTNSIYLIGATIKAASYSAPTPLSTPEILADVQNDNEIYVTWDAVENAGSYIVTCTNQSDQTVTGTEATFTGLANGDYTVSVTAVPSDATAYSNSAAATATVTVSASTVESGGTYYMTPDASSTGLSNTTYITTATSFTYDNITWSMNQWNPSSLQIKTNQSSAANEFRFYNTTAIPGRITKVVITFAALTVSDASKLMFLGGSSAVSATSDGTAGTWDSDAKTLTWTPASTDNFTYFAFYQDGKAASGTNKLATTNAIAVTYE